MGCRRFFILYVDAAADHLGSAPGVYAGSPLALADQQAEPQTSRLRVINGNQTSPATGPFPLSMQTFSRRHSTSERCHKRSFDHLVGAGQDRLWDRKAERLRGLEIDHELELRGRLHRQVAGLFSLEDAANV